MELENVLNEQYFKWLCDLIQRGDYNEDELTLMQLYDTDFEWTIFMDKNINSNSMNLRERFYYEVGFDECSLEEFVLYFGEKANVLEVLVYLADKISNEILTDSKGDRTGDWFWRLYHNLKLDYSESPEEVDSIIYSWINRKFKSDGSGSPFPLKNPPGDERKVEILYQMYAYLHENFEV